MGDLSTYRLSDFILFSESAYYRQFELYNQAIWPLHFVAILFSCVIIYALWKRPAWAGRLVAIILIVSWLWVAWAFLYVRFYQIHIVANWYALGFILQAGLIAWFGVIQNRFNVFTASPWRIKIGSGLLLLSLFLYPLIPVIIGRNWQQFEMFALVPDPTVLATLAILLFYRPHKVLYLIPVIWILISGVTIFIM